MGYVPATVVLAVLSVSVLEPPAVTEAGLNAAVTPVGKPLAERATVWAVPTAVVLTVAVAALPRTTEPEAGATATVKFGATTVRVNVVECVAEPVPVTVIG